MTVSETLISLNRRKLAKDSAVFSVIRSALADHAVEEPTHHASFAEFLGQGWPSPKEPQKGVIGGLFGEFLLAFLLPDKRYKRRQLDVWGISKWLVRGIVEESDPAERPLGTGRRAAGPILQIL